MLCQWKLHLEETQSLFASVQTEIPWLYVYAIETSQFSGSGLQ